MSIIRVEYRDFEFQYEIDIVPIFTKIINNALQTVNKAEVRKRMDFQVNPGVYHVRGYLPSGETVGDEVTVEEDNKTYIVSLRPSDSPHEWLSWQHFLGNISRGDLASGLKMPPNVWLRLWKYNGYEWLVEPFQPYMWLSDENLAAYNYKLDFSKSGKKQLRLLQVGGLEVPWRFISLPPSEKVQIMLRPSPLETLTRLNSGVTVKVISEDWKAELLLHYTSLGAFEAIQTISSNIEHQLNQVFVEASNHAEFAERLLEDKLKNPAGAAMAGYHLLRMGAYERLHNWPNNFANWFSWLPDSSVIHSWQILRQLQQPGFNHELALACRRLVYAVSSGIPVYSEGLRLLIDGLELFIGDPNWSHYHNLEDSIKKVRSYASCVDWGEKLTTYYGAEPTKPSSTPVKGIPDDKTNAYFLNDQ